jgi:hypothetical protein
MEVDLLQGICHPTDSGGEVVEIIEIFDDEEY